MVREYHAFAWRSVRRLGVRDADLDDVVQEVFLTVAKHLDDIHHNSERGYVFRTCGFLAAHARRTMQRRLDVADDVRVSEAIDERPTPEQNAVANQARAQLQAILDAMPKHLGEAFVLFELECMTMIEIADVLDIPMGTVASRLRRAREIFLTAGTAARGEGNTR